MCPALVIMIILAFYGIRKIIAEVDVQTYASQAKTYADRQMEYNALHFDERCEEIMRKRKEKYNSLNGNNK